MKANFQVIKNENIGWDVIDVRGARKDLGMKGVTVDWTRTKFQANKRIVEWLRVNPALNTKLAN